MMNMEFPQCWSNYLKAEQLMEQGHWPEAQYLFEGVLRHLPTHIQTAIDDDNIKPCQFECLLTGLRGSAVAYSEILNRLGKQESAFNALNQSYALLQFVSLESHEIVNKVRSTLSKHSEDLLAHMTAFCSAQRNTHWMLELEQVQRAHHHFNQHTALPASHVIN